MQVDDRKAWNNLALDLEKTVETACDQLRSLPDEIIEARSHEGAWSVKEVVGHLIDSAVNNHQRFVRLQIADDLVFPDYSLDNDAWVAIQRYQDTSWDELLSLWRHFNRHLARVIRTVDLKCLHHVWALDENQSVALGDLMVDYLRHLKEHLGQVLDRS